MGRHEGLWYPTDATKANTPHGWGTRVSCSAGGKAGGRLEKRSIDRLEELVEKVLSSW